MPPKQIDIRRVGPMLRAVPPDMPAQRRDTVKIVLDGQVNGRATLFVPDPRLFGQRVSEQFDRDWSRAVANNCPAGTYTYCLYVEGEGFAEGDSHPRVIIQ